MPKYYVTSGSLKETVLCKDPKESCLIAFRRHINNNSMKFGYVTSVSESGFVIVLPEDMIFETQTILEELGIDIVE